MVKLICMVYMFEAESCLHGVPLPFCTLLDLYRGPFLALHYKRCIENHRSELGQPDQPHYKNITCIQAFVPVPATRVRSVLVQDQQCGCMVCRLGLCCAQWCLVYMSGLRQLQKLSVKQGGQLQVFGLLHPHSMGRRDGCME